VADVQERANEWRGNERTPAGGPQELIQCDAGADPWQIDGPRIVQWYTGEEGMDPEWQPFELVRRDLWHRTRFGSSRTPRSAPAQTLMGLQHPSAPVAINAT
jgi:hypothetical protein